MSKQFYCENCGEEIHIKRKALRNKQVVVELVPLHKCKEGDKNLPNITDNQDPIDPYSKKLDENLRQSSEPTLDDLFNSFGGDKRQTRETKSTAPQGILEQIRSNMPSTPERNIDDMS